MSVGDSVKRFLKAFLFLTLFIPFLVNAAVKVVYDDAKWGANTYITDFKNYRWYIDLNTKKKYGYDGKNFSTVSGFDYGGLINQSEYNISINKNQSYLKTPRSYWTLTSKDSKYYAVENGKFSLFDKNVSVAGVRPTEYIVHQTEVSGQGSYVDPWVFVKPNFYVEIEYFDTVIERDGKIVADGIAQYGDTITYSLKLKNNGLRDPVVNTREIAMVSQVNRIIKMLPETSTVKFGNRNLSLAEAKKAIQDLFSDNGYTFTIVPGQEVSIEFKVLIIGNAGDVVNSQVLYTMDGLEADPGKLNKIAVEKIVQYNEIAENGANVVMALDNSGSMRNQRKVKAIEAAKIFSDSLLGDNTNPNNKICVVLMPCSVIDDNAVEYICSSSNSEVKNYVSRKLTAIDGCMTPYVSALGAANLRIRDLIKQRPGFDSFVIFLSDGNPEVNSNQQYLNTKDKYTAKANTLKEVASLYTIGFETNYAASSILKGLATGKNDNFYIEGNQYFYEADKSNLQDTFRSIARKINEKSKITSKGVLAISRNIDKTKNLIIEVTDTRGIRKEYIKSYDEAISENYIINKGNRYEINIKKFKPTDKISVTYFLERN